MSRINKNNVRAASRRLLQLLESFYSRFGTLSETLCRRPLFSRPPLFQAVLPDESAVLDEIDSNYTAASEHSLSSD